MENKKTQLEINEEVRNEIDKILWTPEDITPKVNTTISYNLQDSTEEKESIAEVTEPVKEEKKDKDNVINLDNKKNTTNEEKKEKKRNVSKAGNPNWYESISEEDRLVPGDIICLTVNGLNKFGEFIEYGKRQGIYWVNMRKKDSLELMSKKWSVKDFECDIVYHNEVLNPKYQVDDKGIYSIK